ncbi:cytochrome P450 CYP72A219-like isoform X1 [Camellia sinensis]|uniref:cytochrome P450 CYP72A219-like isoform X1 n=2 Tax=Camellia sinensis TaxID=4442 RepID=UPI0010358699|nr:cytochrome P450 CYP72A219-like isoform X1 [Camellia sinensis]
MEVTVSSIVGSVALVSLLTCAWRVVKWVWWRPKQIEKRLREQGFKGNPYKLLYGDMKEMISVMKEARSKPMDASSDDIVPHVIPSYHHCLNLHGKDYFQWMGTTPRVTIANPKHIKEILFNHEVFQKPKQNLVLRYLVRGLGTYEGEKWAKHRNLINPAFHLEKLKHMVPAMCSSCNEMISNWEVLVSSTKGSCEVDVWPYLDNLTADVISRTAFGSNYEEGKRIFQLQKKQTDLIIKLLRSFYIPGWRFLPTKTNRQIKTNCEEVRALIRNIIINKREQTIEGGDGDNDLLGILWETNLKASQEQGNKKNITLTTDEVIEECKLFYFAGQETTSALLVWTMVLLSKHQKWQALAREEVLAVFGAKKPEYDGLNQLKTITMILYEVLRLYPPVAYIVRTILKKARVGELVLPPGVELFVPMIALHHDREIWGEDATEFKPDRFSEGITKATKEPGTFFPFSGGPRICIGQNFAMVEAKIALAMILQHFSFQLSPSYVHAPFHVFTLQPQHGVHLVLQKI